GFEPIALRRRTLDASSGSTPFDVLFLLFSGFLIGSALLLIALLAWLAIDARGAELALLGATGLDRRARTRLLLAELGPVTGVGALAGAALGVAYAALLLWLLRTVWLGAIGEPFLRLAPSPTAIFAGGAIAWLVGMAAAATAVRRAARTPPRTALGATGDELAKASRGTPYGVIAALGAIAGVATMTGGTLRGEAAAGAFFAAGAAALAAAVLAVGRVADAATRGGGPVGRGASLGRLAVGNTLCRRGRSLLTLGLVAASCFLLVATSAFRLDPTASGVGGFGLVATSDTPLVHDLATPAGRWELGFDDPDEAAFAGQRVHGFRVQPGADASCANLYQTQQPRLLGATPRFIAEASGGEAPFAWAEVDPAFADNPWAALEAPPEDDTIPVVLDFNTAVYSLKLYGGVGSTLTVEDESGAEVTLRVAGLLKNSVLQGDAIMAEARLLQRFPSVAGYRFFLLGDAASAGELGPLSEDRLSDYGFDAEPAATRLARFLAVQNTYLSTFQALGAFGLLLGVVGLAVAQTRNLNERRGELAQLRAAGFGVARLRRLVLAENLLVVVTGLAIGSLAAAWTLAPLVARGDTRAPWLAGTTLLAAVCAAAFVSARVAGDRALRAPIVGALRGD
ncbi:MAG: ABC transporter permease, partial [Planctomycetota bacterium]